MRDWLALAASLSVALPCSAGEFDPFDGPRPIAVYIQSGPWAAVLGADNPRVAIYENGEVIFTRRVDGTDLYHRTTLDAGRLDDVRRRLAPVLAIRDLKRSYTTVQGVDHLPEARFYLRAGERERMSSVHGALPPHCSPDPRAPRLTHEAQRGVVPAELRALHEWLCTLDAPGASRWEPKYVEVMLWDYGYAPGESIHWPTQWPALDSDRAIVRRAGAYSIFLDGSLLPEVARFLATCEDKGAVEVSGKKLTAAYRPTFPSEPVWREFRGAAR